ncbi:hypothetical protein PanWU01x14_220160 [Parasponia andersonii]|uniref:Uncharacterized protein n=1 Tax=Parasponia andersonii TaxID=3476 RepID=A0A2P5BQ80_PARAD|nr:hypothetical protein PanWU01x14_220160 [Parasponia andersonii]
MERALHCSHLAIMPSTFEGGLFVCRHVQPYSPGWEKVPREDRAKILSQVEVRFFLKLRDALISGDNKLPRMSCDWN